MVFEVPAAEGASVENQFVFTINGKRYAIPKLKFAPVEVAAEAERGRVVTSILAACGTEDSPARQAVTRLDGDQVRALVIAWCEDSGIDTGELRASSGS